MTLFEAKVKNQENRNENRDYWRDNMGYEVNESIISMINKRIKNFNSLIGSILS